MKRIVLMIVMMALSLLAKSQNKLGFDLMVSALISSSVDTVNSPEVQQMMQGETTVLLDAREKDEYDVSHLEGARWVGYTDFNLERLEGISKSDTIIVYCSIGKRSGDVGEKLQKAGYIHVFNLFGGIFDWTNRGEKVVDDSDQSVKYVHPYSTTWGIWVNNYEKRYEPR